MLRLAGHSVKAALHWGSRVHERSPVFPGPPVLRQARGWHCFRDQQSRATLRLRPTLNFATQADGLLPVSSAWTAVSPAARRVSGVAVRAFGAAAPAGNAEPGRSAHGCFWPCHPVDSVYSLRVLQSADSGLQKRWPSVIRWILRVVAGVIVSAALLLALLPGIMSTRRGRDSCLSVANRFVPGEYFKHKPAHTPYH